MGIDVQASNHTLSLPKHNVNDNRHNDYLCEYSPHDHIWDVHKAQAITVAQHLEQGQEHHQKQAQRVIECAESLEFGWIIDFESGETCLKLRRVYFCRVRHCPICQWRRLLMWVARLYQAFPKIYADHPDWRYILVTFTVRNCPITELKATINDMGKAWKRLTRRNFPALAFIRALEVTKQASNGYAHPHYHVLMAVKPSYFSRDYLSTIKWAKLWQQALRADYTPVCDARIVKLNPKKAQFKANVESYLYVFSAIKEVLKYTVKPDDLTDDAQWLIELSDQLCKIRAVNVGGEFKKYLKEDEEKDGQELITSGQDKGNSNLGGVHFGWRNKVEKYQIMDKKCKKKSENE